MPHHQGMKTIGIDAHPKTLQIDEGSAECVIRVITYNIHGCVDINRKLNPGKLSEIIGELDADIIALQEVDAQLPLSNNRNQARFLAEKLHMNYVFFPTENIGLHTFGLAILSRFKFNEYHHIFLPNLYPRLKPRKRGSIRANIQTPDGPINLINTHLSLFKLERRKQMKTLMGKGWLMAVPKGEPVVICGDLNAGPLSKTYRTLSRYFTDVQKDWTVPRTSAYQPTFHSKSPLFRIDHIFVSDHFQTLNVEVRKTHDTQSASDHLPLIADLAVNK